MKVWPVEPDPARRRFLACGCRLAATCLTLPLWNLLQGCVPAQPEPEPLHITLDEIPLGRRVRYIQNGRALEVLRTSDGVTARSLLCTHQGCNVRWLEERQIYLCPCHDGQFDPQGRPIYGPPRRALEMLSVTVTETEVIVGG